MDDAALISLAEQAVAAAKRAGADGADAYAATSADVTAGIRHGAPETIERSESRGVGLRVFIGQASATLSTSDITPDALARLAEQAVAIARVAPADPHAALADAALLAKQYATLDTDTSMPDIATLQSLAREAEEAGRTAAGITNSEGGDASAGQYNVALATSTGFSGQYRRSSYSLSASLIAGTGESMQRDYDYAVTTRFDALPDAASIGIEAAKRATERMNPRKIPSQSATVYLDPRCGKQLLGALAGAISGAAITRGTSFLKDALGTAVFYPAITITDDPLLVHGLASRPFDAEGIAAQPRNFIDAGVLTSWILDTRSANQLGLTTTGHASRGLASAPSPSSTNLYMQPGTLSPEELFAQLGDGFYITETIGHGTNLITGDYSVGASGFWLEGGVRAYPVSEVTIAGNLRDMFARLVPANDLVFKTSVNVPTLAIPAMTIAGS